MANYSHLYVIGEESENDLEDFNENEMFIRYNRDSAKELEMFNSLSRLGQEEQDGEWGPTKKKHSKNTNMSSGDLNLHNDTERSKATGTKHSLPRGKNAIFEPTYKMDPHPDQYFVWYKVRNALNKVIGPLFDNFTYQSRTAGNLCKVICNKSMATIKKKFDWPRYRYVCHVTLLQLNHQAVIVADRSLKFAETDSYAVCLFKNKDAVLIVTFYGIFYE